MRRAQPRDGGSAGGREGGKEGRQAAGGRWHLHSGRRCQSGRDSGRSQQARAVSRGAAGCFECCRDGRGLPAAREAQTQALVQALALPGGGLRRAAVGGCSWAAASGGWAGPGRRRTGGGRHSCSGGHSGREPAARTARAEPRVSSPTSQLQPLHIMPGAATAPPSTPQHSIQWLSHGMVETTPTPTPSHLPCGH